MIKETKTRFWVGLGIFLATFIVYLKTMAPTASFWDCGEFITISKILGIPHPPGYPLYAIVGRVTIMLLPFFKEAAFRVNMLSPFFSALTIAMVYLLTVKLIVVWKGEPKDLLDEIIVHLAGAAAALFLAFSPTWWDNSIEAEVYGMAMFVMSLTVWLAMRWRDQIGRVGNRKMLLLIVYLFTLGIAGHMSTLLAAGPILLFILLVDWKALLDWKFLTWSAGLVFAGITINYYLLLRANLDPALNMCNPRDWDSLMYVLQRKQYEPFNFFTRREDFMYQFGHMFLRYFAWQFAPIIRPGVSELHGPLALYISSIPMILGIFGAICHLVEGEEKRFGITAAALLIAGVMVALFANSPVATVLIALGVVAGFFHVYKRKDKSFSIVGPAFIITSLGLVVYLNMANPQPRERDYIFAPAYLFFAIWIGLGAWRLMQIVKGILLKENAKWSRNVVIAIGGIIILIALFNIKQYYFEKNRSANWIPNEYGYNILQSAETGGIIFTNGDNDTYPVWFMQETNGIRQDVRIVNLSLANTDWYLKQAIRHGVPLDLSDYQIDQLSGRGYITEDRQIFKLSDIAIRVIIASNAGKKLSFQQILAPADSFTKLVFDKDYKEKYPIYFAVTVSDDNLTGLQKHLSFEGLLYRVTSKESNKQVNLDLTRKNMNEVYRFRGIADPKLYKDENTQRLLGNYAVAYWQLGMAMRREAENARKANDETGFKEWMIGAVEQFQKAYNILPDEPASYNWLGVAYAELGDYGKASEWLQKLAQKDPGNPYAKLQIGSIFQQGKMYDSAELYYQQSMMQDPNLAEAYGRLYGLYIEKKDYPKAASILQDWLRKNPNDPVAGKMLKELQQKMR
jgi:tetratricopeptide (TPR) repeat protein